MFKRSRSPRRCRPRLILELLESRTLLSASTLDTLVSAPQSVLTASSQANTTVTPQGHPGGSGVTNPTPNGYTPSQIQNAYGFNQITFSNGSIKGDGTGQTIAIVDAYNDPNIQSDLKAFDAQFGLPAANLTVVNQNGGSKLPATIASWALEISLDVEWAHAMAPGAKILLVEASSNGLSNLLNAVNYASQHANVVSMSWGSSEFSSESSYDSYFSKPGVTFVASSGDSGAPTSWPAVSPNVVAVGGTTLKLNSSGGYGSETGWSGSGGGDSSYEKEPTYQTGVQSTGERSNPDVAYNADPNTGYAVYDTLNYYGQTGWFEVGGTSAGAPQVSALVAIANQGRALAGLGSLSGASQTLPALYNMSSSDFHDITSGTSTGSPSYSAGTGYDLVTGRGTPLANLVVQALVNASSTGNVGGLVATNSSTTTSSTPVKKAAILGGDPSDPTSSSGTVSLVLQAFATSQPTILIRPVETIGTATIFPFGTASVLSSAFGAGANFVPPGTNNLGQTSASLATAFGLQFYAPAPKSISSPPENMGNYLSPFPNYSPDAVPPTAAEDSEDLWADGPLVPRRTIRISTFQGDIELEQAPRLSTKGQSAEVPADDAFFVDEASMALLAEEDVTEASGQFELALRLRVPALALLGVLASSFWIVPDAAEEDRKRHVILV